MRDVMARTIEEGGGDDEDMIKNFKCNETEDLFHDRPSRFKGMGIDRPARRKLLYLDKVKSLQDLKVPPGNRLEALSGDRVGLFSIRINEQWRICFKWKNNDAYDVEIVDYH